MPDEKKKSRLRLKLEAIPPPDYSDPNRSWLPGAETIGPQSSKSFFDPASGPKPQPEPDYTNWSPAAGAETIRPRTWRDKLQDVKDTVGRTIAPVFGIDFDQAVEDQIAGKPVKQQIVYHGSPFKFDKFSRVKAGTGAGGAAYGEGIYLAENPAVARSYKPGQGSMFNTQTPIQIGEQVMPRGGLWTASDRAYRQGDYVSGHMYDLLARAEEHGVQSARELTKLVKERPGLWKGSNWRPEEVEEALSRIRKEAVFHRPSMYKVDLPDESIPKMLDWDKPFAEQSESVRAALQPEIERLKSGAAQADKGWGALADPNLVEQLQTGESIYRGLGLSTGKPKSAVSEYLNTLDIPGIKYLDQGSRGVGEGTRNFVVFNEELPKILKRYGGAAGVGVGTVGAAQQEPQKPQTRLGQLLQRLKQ